ncbi:unnamed protein product [Rotaria sp. Silwood2]|nr:unnamed protein product [Rotaria sp. Silwood2]CAF4337525.1 unnamed protein product [Rotaria sp. Silwood2]
MSSPTSNDAANNTGGNKDSDTKLVVPIDTTNDLATTGTMSTADFATAQYDEQGKQKNHIESNTKSPNDNNNDTTNQTEKSIVDSPAVMNDKSNTESKEGFTSKHIKNGNAKDGSLIQHNNELQIIENQEKNERTLLPNNENNGTISTESAVSSDSLSFDKSKDAIENKNRNQNFLFDNDGHDTNTSEFRNNQSGKPTDFPESSASANMNSCTTNSIKCPLTSKKSCIHLYVLRHVEPKEEFDMEVVFSKAAKFPMIATPIKELNHKPGPYIYSIQLDLTQAHDGCWFFPDESASDRFDLYFIRIKQTSLKVTKWHYDDQQKRSLNTLRETSHLFIFDSYFNKSYGTRPPGKP